VGARLGPHCFGSRKSLWIFRRIRSAHQHSRTSRGPPPAENKSDRRKTVIVVRERGGNIVPAVFRCEKSALAFIRSRIAPGTVSADESPNWNELHARFEMKRINHEEAYSLNGLCTNWAEEFFSRMRRAEVGHHHHITGRLNVIDSIR
jgi:hypothetical protein